jgi:alpha-N-acetylglucosamine transferase
MIGFSEPNANMSDYEKDIKLLKAHNVKVLFLPRITRSKDKVSFAEATLLKITAWSLIEYDRVQYFDGDILPTQNMDCFFQLRENSFNTGNASPLVNEL